MKILLSGCSGYMGKEVAKLCKNNFCGAEVAAGVDINSCPDAGFPCFTSFDCAPTDVDCIVDFSHHSVTKDLLNFAVKNKLPLVIATTGQTEEERFEIMKASEYIPLFFAANYSFGIALLIDLAKKTAAAMPDAEIEIIEKHHDRKVDAPSGTAIAIANAITEVRPTATIVTGRSGMGKRTKEEIGIHAIRMGNIVGEHEVIIGTPNQTITLKHEAHDRALFAEGALTAAKFLYNKPAGFYNMNDLI